MKNIRLKDGPSSKKVTNLDYFKLGLYQSERNRYFLEITRGQSSSEKEVTDE